MLIFSSCDAIFEENIEESSLQIIYPQDSTKTAVQTVDFRWEELEGADEYRIQIVSPNFDGITSFITDTTVATTNMVYTLLPGEYQWKIRAQNYGYESPYQVYSLTIDSTYDLASQVIVLTKPTDGTHINESTIFFEWSDLLSAEEYKFELSTYSSFATKDIEETTSINEYSNSSLAEGVYFWRVRALNATSASLYYESSFTVDRTAPTAATLLTPVNNSATIASPITLDWNSASDVSVDSLYIYSPDSLTLLTSYPVSLTTSSYSFTPPVDANYYWRVKSADLAGNTNWSSFYKFTKN